MISDDVIPPLLPVLDILHGDVVRGVAGERESYRPLQTPLADGSRPGDVARGLRELVRHDWLYVADLDAIQHDEPQWDSMENLIADGCRIVVDAGVREPRRAEQLIEMGAARVIVALETLASRDELASIIAAVGGERTLFSLDLKQGRLLGDPAVWGDDDPISIGNWAIGEGIGGVIVLDLAGVGVGQGVPTADLCRALRSAHPEVTLITGGGVRDISDVHNLWKTGADSVLVSSALHRQKIEPDDIARTSLV